MSSGKITLPHICPKCGKTANNESDLREKFGFKTKKKDNREKRIKKKSRCMYCS